MTDKPVDRVRLRSGIQIINGITGETGPLYSEYVLAEHYDALRAEVSRLRGIVQADLEEKAEAWGEVERLRADAERYQFIKANVRRLDINGLCLSIQNLEVRIDQMRASASPGAAHADPMDGVRLGTFSNPAEPAQE